VLANRKDLDNIKKPVLYTSRGCLRLCCEERSECGNLMLVAKNDEITTLSSIARDAEVAHYFDHSILNNLRDFVAFKQQTRQLCIQKNRILGSLVLQDITGRIPCFLRFFLFPL
jgi:hypothetical protein